MTPLEETFAQRLARQSDDAIEAQGGGRPNGTIRQTANRCTCAWHMGMRDPEPGCPVDHDRRAPLFQYTGQIDGKAIRVDVVWDGFEPRMKWSTHDPA